MSVYDQLYLSLLALSLGISLYSAPSFELNVGFKVFPYLLRISLLTEILVHIISYGFRQKYYFVYHFYLPVDYSFLAYFFYVNINNRRVRQYVRISIPAYISVSFFTTLYYYFSSGGNFPFPGLNLNPEGLLLICWSILVLFSITPNTDIDIYSLPFPGLNLNIEGLLLIAWSLITLFSIRPTIDLDIFKLPVFWICLGVLMFFSGTFFFNGVYNNLIQNESPFVKALHIIIVKGLNYVLYICFSIGFLCSNQMKKYISLSLPVRY